MTNLDKWRFYCQDFKSPDIFIEFGFYALISAALQRRVWRGSLRKPLFPNTFTFFIAPPGVGKGLVVEEIEKVLKHKDLIMTEDELRNDKLFGTMHLNKEAKSNGVIEYPSRVFLGSNSTTYEFMVFDMARNIRSFSFDEGTLKKFYVHCSVCYCLGELGSLFRKNMDDLVIFLLQAYDCGDYKKSILSRTEDEITNCCLNLIAAAQPSFIRKVFNQDLVDGGFASRGFFVYGEENRFNRAKPPEFTPEQIQAHTEIVQHVKKVSGLFGEVKFTDEASAYLEHWSDKILPERRKFVHERLKAIHARKEVGAQKLAMAIHFAESTEMVVNKEECERAVEALERLDKDMLKCFMAAPKNPLDDVMKEILRKIRMETANSGGIGMNALLMEFFRDLPEGKKSLEQIRDFLLGTGQIEIVNGKIKEKKAS